MSTAKHTPGPWEVEIDEDGGTIQMGAASYLSDPGIYDPVHHVELYDCMYPEDGEQFEEAKANATLWATAPELLAALKDLLKCCDEFARRVGWPDNKPRESARAAIAKAEAQC